MNEKKDYIPALGYNWLTNFYDFMIKITMPEKKFRTCLINHLNLTSTDKVLEFGFGTAQNLIYAYNINPKCIYVGLDIDPKVKTIAEAKLKSKKIDIKLDLYDGNDFPYESNSFDKVFSSLVFHQLEKKDKISSLKEIKRVLKPGGTFILSDWGKASSFLMRILFLTVQFLDGFKTTTENVKGLIPKYIKETGFKDVSQIGSINTKIGTFCFYRSIK